MAQVPTRLNLSRDVAQADWIHERMDQSLRAVVGGSIPDGYEAYARILHPAEQGGHPVRWAEVARRVNRELMPGDWFQDLVDWPVEVGPDFTEPRHGEIPDEVQDLLLPILSRHTASRHGWFCFWAGWAFVHGGTGRMVPRAASSTAAGPATRFAARPAYDIGAAKASRLSWRPDYVLFEGPLMITDELGAELATAPGGRESVQARPYGEFQRKTPCMFWPDDRRWCAVNDIEASFTWIGGSLSLIDTLYRNGALEVAAVE